MSEPIKLALSPDAETQLKKELKSRIQALQTGLKPLHQTNLPKWRRIYEAQPAEKTRDFPFQNASNLVVPVAGIHCDTLKARILSAVWKIRPVWMTNILGSYDGPGDDIREAWQEWLQYNALEPTELDLYRVESEFFGEIIRYGTSVIKIPYEKLYEDYMVPAGDGTSRYESISELVYQGPKPEKLAFEDFLTNPSAKTFEASDIAVHRIRYKKHELLERRFNQFFKANRVDAIIAHPDRTYPDFVQSEREQDMNARTSQHDGYAEWDVFECWLPYRAPNSKKAPKIIVWYHMKSDTIMSAIYDTYSPILKSRPFVMGRLLYRDDSLYGYGLCEILEMLQEEISTMHNQRRDNVLVANTRIWRANPDSKLHQGYQIYPSAMLPAEEGELEAIAAGEVSQITIEEERLSMDLAERRSGVSPPMQGMGAGGQTKRGVYTAMGTMSLLQEGNSRTDLNIADMRYAHTKIGRMLSLEYAHLGIDASKLVQFGARAEFIKKAAELLRSGKLGLPVSAATSSINKEMEKQNDMMLSQVMARHYMSITQLLQQAATSVLPLEVRDYSIKVIEASDRFIKQLLRHFDHDDIDALVPKAMSPGQQGAPPPNAGPNNGLAVVPPPTSPQYPVQPRTQESADLLAGMAAFGGAGATQGKQR